MTDTSENLSMNTLALIFSSGQQDQFGRTWPLAVFGTTHNGRSVTVTRNVRPSVYHVRRVLAMAEDWKMTNLHVGPDCCG